MKLLHTSWMKHPETGVPVVLEYDTESELISMRLYCTAFGKLHISQEDKKVKRTEELCKQFYHQCSSVAESNRILAAEFPEAFQQGIRFDA